MPLFELCRSQGMLNHINTCQLFVKHNLLPALQWAITNKLPWSIDCLEIAIYNRNDKIKDWINYNVWNFLNEDQQLELNLILDREYLFPRNGCYCGECHLQKYYCCGYCDYKHHQIEFDEDIAEEIASYYDFGLEDWSKQAIEECSYYYQEVHTAVLNRLTPFQEQYECLVKEAEEWCDQVEFEPDEILLTINH